MNQGGASANDHGRGRNTGSTCQISRDAADARAVPYQNQRMN